MADEIKKARLGGIKISAELVRVDCAVTDTSHFLPELCELLTEHQINMHFLTVNNDRNNGSISFCLASEDIHRLNQVLSDRPELNNSVVFSSPGRPFVNLPGPGRFECPGIVPGIF